MHRISVAILSLFVVVIVGSTWTLSGQDASANQYKGSGGELCIPMGSFTINPPSSVQQKRSSVEFPHSRHFVYKCTRCHHEWDAATPIKTCMTTGCHNETTVTKKPLKDGSYTDTALKYYKYAYHNQCRGCHKELRAIQEEAAQSIEAADEAPEAGPTGCIKCHPK